MAKIVYSLVLLAVLCRHQAAGASLRGTKEPVSAIDSPLIKAKMEELYGGKIDTEKLKRTWEHDPWSTLKTVLGSKPFFDYLQLKRGGATDTETRVDGIDLDLVQTAPINADGTPNAPTQAQLQEAAKALQTLGQQSVQVAQQNANKIQGALTSQDGKLLEDTLRTAKRQQDAVIMDAYAKSGFSFSKEQLKEFYKAKETPPLVEARMEMQAPFLIFDNYMKNKGRIDATLEKSAVAGNAQNVKTAEMVYQMVKQGTIWAALQDPLNLDLWTIPVEDTEEGAAFFAKPENNLEVPETITEVSDIKDWLEGKI